jgi:hypothetical protein
MNMGNVRVRGHAALLDHPFLIPVIVSTKISEDERNAQVERILAQVKQGGAGWVYITWRTNRCSGGFYDAANPDLQ